MITYGNLEGIAFSVLTGTFNLAFSDYSLPMHMSEDDMKNHLSSNSFDPSLSCGAFENGCLVGFVFIGRRGRMIYDAGTAVVKEYRGKHVASDMLRHIIESMKADGVSEFVLECISGNEKALNLYRSLGFTEKRKLRCHTLEGLGTFSDDVSECDDFSPTCQDFEPSWQNAPESLDDCVLSFCHGSNRMVVRKSGSVCYSSADRVLISHVLKAFGRLRFVNVLKDSDLDKLLREMGSKVFAEQIEMHIMKP
ncbi:MAG: GNAT family N-acetyltransferase [Bullifex sp.]